MQSDENIYYKYTFTFGKDHEFDIDIQLDPKTLAYIQPPNPYMPEWTRLDFESCEGCPLAAAGATHCPVAVNISALVEGIGVLPGSRVLEMTIVTKDRTYHKEQTALRNALSALFGIYMVTSGCELLDMLRPMVHFHLPFASVDDTIYRAISMYFLAQYIRKGKGLEADWSLDGLAEIYRRIRQVNENMLARLRKLPDQDASIEAVVLLNLFAKTIASPLDEKLDKMKAYFQAYLT